MSDSKIQIEDMRDGTLRATYGGGIGLTKTIPEVEAEALREYFQAERDEQLGWWRASPEFGVRPRDGDGVIGSRSVTVLNERLGITTTVWEGDDSRSGYGMAARAYFDAHPKPKPWLDAKPGEAWVIEVGGVERAATVIRYGSGAAFSWGSDGGAVHSNVPTTADGITAGRRVWPVDEEGDNDE